ncbi:hypothetical protein MY3296_001421 [Beauveria thailandica]
MDTLDDNRQSRELCQETPPPSRQDHVAGKNIKSAAMRISAR